MIGYTIILSSLVIVYIVTFVGVFIVSFSGASIPATYPLDATKNILNGINAAISAIVIAEVATFSKKSNESGVVSRNVVPSLDRGIRIRITNGFIILWCVVGILALGVTFLNRDVTGILQPIGTAWFGAALPALTAYGTEPKG